MKTLIFAAIAGLIGFAINQEITFHEWKVAAAKAVRCTAPKGSNMNLNGNSIESPEEFLELIRHN